MDKEIKEKLIEELNKSLEEAKEGGNKDKAKSMHFKDKHKFQMELAGSILEESESPFSSIPLNKDEFEIFKEYMNSGAYTKDYPDYQQKILLDYLNSHNF